MFGFLRLKKKREIECRHVWSTNTGRGDAPNFKKMDGRDVNHVMCVHCRARTWLSPEQLVELHGDDHVTMLSVDDWKVCN